MAIAKVDLLKNKERKIFLNFFECGARYGGLAKELLVVYVELRMLIIIHLKEFGNQGGFRRQW